MVAARAGMLVASLVAASPLAHAQTQTAAAPGAPPRLLNIIVVKAKHRAAGAYGALEASIVRAYERAKVNVYWVGLQSSKDANDILYLNLHDSPEAAERVAGAYREALKQHPELSRMQQRLEELSASETSMLATRRDDVDQPAGRPDFATMRALRLTIVQVRPGHEGGFVAAVRTANARDRSWLVYEANETSTFLLITPMREARGKRHDGPPIPRTLRRSRGVYTKADTRVYAVRPAMSHVPETFAAANRQFWRPWSAGLH